MCRAANTPLFGTFYGDQPLIGALDELLALAGELALSCMHEALACMVT